MDQGIVTPHDHDVLSGRGNFVNYHAGNEHFRALVRKHKVAYVACPKPQKGKFSRMIVDEIRNRNPPGRFLKQDLATKLWYDIGEKKALDKTRQALREGAPEIMKEIGVDDEGGPDQEVVRQNSSGDEIPLDNHQVLPPMQEPGLKMNPGNLGQMHHGQYVPQPVANPFDETHGMDPPPRMVRNDVGPPPQMSMPSNPAPQRIMRNGMVPTSGVVPVRSLAGIRQAMQQQAQRNNTYLQQQYQQGGNQGGMGMGGYGGYSNMHQTMMDQLEPRPIGPGSGGGGANYDTSPGDLESYENVGPLPGPLPQRYSRDRSREMQREASDRSINMEKVFGLGSSHAKTMDNSVISTMSLSIGDIVTKINGEDGKNGSTDLTDADQLAPLFDSSIRLGPSEKGSSEKRRKAPNRSSSSDGQDLAKVMDMSVMSLGGELSEIGDGSMLRMTGSSANMSFTNVFDE